MREEKEKAECSGYNDTRWKESEFVKNFLDQAEAFIPERRRLISIALSYAKGFLPAPPERVLDLGSGDGIFTEEIFKRFGACEAVLVDASPEMVKAAAERFKGRAGIELVNRTFEEVVEEDLLKGSFSLAVSSLAIHHMPAEAKRSLYEYIFERLAPGSVFVNIDTVLSPTEELEAWYLDEWIAWIKEHGVMTEEFQDVPKHYKENKGNTPDPLSMQLSLLSEIGYSNVDCFFKYGIFTVFGGSRPESP